MIPPIKSAIKPNTSGIFLPIEQEFPNVVVRRLSIYIGSVISITGFSIWTLIDLANNKLSKREIIGLVTSIVFLLIVWIWDNVKQNKYDRIRSKLLDKAIDQYKIERLKANYLFEELGLSKEPVDGSSPIITAYGTIYFDDFRIWIEFNVDQVGVGHGQDIIIFDYENKLPVAIFIMTKENRTCRAYQRMIFDSEWEARMHSKKTDDNFCCTYIVANGIYTE